MDANNVLMKRDGGGEVELEPIYFAVVFWKAMEVSVGFKYAYV